MWAKILERLKKYPFGPRTTSEVFEKAASKSSEAAKAVKELFTKETFKELFKNNYGKIVLGVGSAGVAASAGVFYKNFKRTAESIQMGDLTILPDFKEDNHSFLWASKMLSAKFNDEEMLALDIYINNSAFGDPGFRDFPMAGYEAPVSGAMLVSCRQMAFESWVRKQCHGGRSWFQYIDLVKAGYDMIAAVGQEDVVNDPANAKKKKGKKKTPNTPPNITPGQKSDKFEEAAYDVGPMQFSSEEDDYDEEDVDYIEDDETDTEESEVDQEDENPQPSPSPAPNQDAPVIKPGKPVLSKEHYIWKIPFKVYPASLVDWGLHNAMQAKDVQGIPSIKDMASYTYALITDNPQIFGSNVDAAWGGHIPVGSELLLRKQLAVSSAFQAPRAYDGNWYKAFKKEMDDYISKKAAIVSLSESDALA